MGVYKELCVIDGHGGRRGCSRRLLDTGLLGREETVEDRSKTNLQQNKNEGGFLRLAAGFFLVRIEHFLFAFAFSTFALTWSFCYLWTGPDVKRVYYKSWKEKWGLVGDFREGNGVLVSLAWNL
jgi:hypothetical protein